MFFKNTKESIKIALTNLIHTTILGVVEYHWSDF